MDRSLAPARRLVRQLSRVVLDSVLPSECSACRDLGPSLCLECRRNLLRDSPRGCPRCGAALTPTGRCLADHRELAGILQLLAPYRFAGTGGRLVRRFKLDGDAAAGRWLARAMADRVREAANLPRSVVVSVPLHRARRRKRGFDQAAWLADGIARRLRMPIATGVLQRSRRTAPQGDPRVGSRAQNVRGAFVIRQSEPVAGRSILLVDDVFTTGATARACARQLLDAGAVGVRLLVACRSR